MRMSGIPARMTAAFFGSTADQGPFSNAEVRSPEYGFTATLSARARFQWAGALGVGRGDGNPFAKEAPRGEPQKMKPSSRC